MNYLTLELGNNYFEIIIELQLNKYAFIKKYLRIPFSNHFCSWQSQNMYKEKENPIHWRFSRAAITFFATYPIGSGWLTRERWLAQTCPLCMPIAQLVPRCRYVGPRPSKLQGVATYWRYCFTVCHVEIFLYRLISKLWLLLEYGIMGFYDL